MICVKDLLKLESFQRISLAAGETGLYRRVSWPNIAQTVSIREWLLGGDVVLMTGIGLENTADSLNHMIRQAADGDAACLIILLSDTLIPQIPWETIDFANRLKFPLFAAPWEIQIASVIRDISSLILKDQYGESCMNELLEALLLRNDVVSPELMQNFLEKYQMSGPHRVIVAASGLSGCPAKAAHRLEMVSFQRQVNGLIIQEMKHIFPQSFYINRNHQLIFLVSLNVVRECEIKDKLIALKEIILRQYGKINVNFGIGKTYTCPENFKKSCAEALKALNFQTDDGVTAFDDLGIFQLLLEVPDQNLVRTYAAGQLSPLIEYDEKYHKNLLATLETYLLTNCNYVKTAQLMYLHRNTLAYRMEKIRELLGLTIEDAQVRNHLFNCLKILRYSR